MARCQRLLSRSNNLWVGLQVHGTVVKVGLHLNLYVGNELVAMYGKCKCLKETRQVFDEMPHGCCLPNSN